MVDLTSSTVSSDWYLGFDLDVPTGSVLVFIALFLVSHFQEQSDRS